MKTLIVTIIKYIIGWYFGTKLQQNKTRKEIARLEKRREEIIDEQIKAIRNGDGNRINRLDKERVQISTKLGKLRKRQRKNIRIEIE